MKTVHQSNSLLLSKNCLFTSESVSEGHPDKMADQVFDRTLDASLVLDSSVMADTYGTGKRFDEDLESLVRHHFKLTPRGLITTFDLECSIYAKTSAYEHFGRTEAELPRKEIGIRGLI